MKGTQKQHKTAAWIAGLILAAMVFVALRTVRMLTTAPKTAAPVPAWTARYAGHQVVPLGTVAVLSLTAAVLHATTLHHTFMLGAYPEVLRRLAAGPHARNRIHAQMRRLAMNAIRSRIVLTIFVVQHVLTGQRRLMRALITQEPPKSYIAPIVNLLSVPTVGMKAATIRSAAAAPMMIAVA